MTVFFPCPHPDEQAIRPGRVKRRVRKNPNKILTGLMTRLARSGKKKKHKKRKRRK